MTKINSEHHSSGLVLYNTSHKDTRALCKRGLCLVRRLKIKTNSENSESEWKHEIKNQ